MTQLAGMRYFLQHYTGCSNIQTGFSCDPQPHAWYYASAYRWQVEGDHIARRVAEHVVSAAADEGAEQGSQQEGDIHDLDTPCRISYRQAMRNKP